MPTWESEMTPEEWNKLKGIIGRTINALENVPEVNGIYDQQHSDTQIAAILELKGMMKWEYRTHIYLQKNK